MRIVAQILIGIALFVAAGCIEPDHSSPLSMPTPVGSDDPGLDRAAMIGYAVMLGGGFVVFLAICVAQSINLRHATRPKPVNPYDRP